MCSMLYPEPELPHSVNNGIGQQVGKVSRAGGFGGASNGRHVARGRAGTRRGKWWGKGSRGQILGVQATRECKI